MKKALTLLLLCLNMVLAASAQQDYTVKSPDRKIAFNLKLDGTLQYSVTIDGKSVIDWSELGYTRESTSDGLSEFLVPPSRKPERKMEVWHPLWGKRSIVKAEYNEQTYAIGSGVDECILVRVFNDGAAFRLCSGTDGIRENTEFNFAGDYTAWYYNGERHNIGPELLSDASGERLPLATIKVSDDLYLALHEADLPYDGWPMRLMAEKGTTTLKIAPEKISGFKDEFVGAWRVLMVGKTPGELVDSHLLELLNPEADGDFSWVTPGVDLWDWRIDGAVWDGYHYGMNYDSWVRMVDFAAQNGFRNLVLDANWYGPEFEKDSDPTKGDKARDVQRIIKYGKEKGVGLWLYLNDVAGTNYPIEETLAQYEQWGAAGVKYGFMNGNPQEKNRKTQDITRLCAKHHLMVDYHDYPVHPFGQMRTWPNAVTREYCKAQLDGRQIFQPKTFVTSAFVNMVAGPVDMNNGFMELHQGRTTRKDNNQEVPTTVTGEIARTLITWSGATVIPDIPEYYRRYPRLLEFLAAEKQPWQESRTLQGEIGEYIVMARRNADGDWLVGAATNEESRTLSIGLDFLGRGKYTAVINTDASDTDFRTNRETFENTEMTVTRKSTVQLRLAPGGGACVLIRKQ
ncbi:MAG: glycoside hydrolase family 97 protein [Bacteroidaceae bacterium]|nr:glycoside hydrolase family 97 protein [Bacteroidaceae bacterium]